MDSEPHSIANPVLLALSSQLQGAPASPGLNVELAHWQGSGVTMGRDSADGGRNTPFNKSPTLGRHSTSSHSGVTVAAVVARPSSTGQAPAVVIQQQATQVANNSSTDLEAAISPDQPLLRPAATSSGLDSTSEEYESKLKLAYNCSWVVNILLFGAKAVVWWLSGSKSVLASLVDSFVDLVSQIVIFWAEWKSKKADPQFPVGKARLETIGVLACACIMSVAAYSVIQDSGIALYDGLVKEDIPQLDTSLAMYSVLVAATVLKLFTYILCVALKDKSDSMLALAEDHLNDIVSNVGAIITTAIAACVAGAWWADPAGGITISLFILWRWYDIAKSQLDKIVGRAAPGELVQQLREVADAHHENLEVDCLRAYHFGARFMVEAEVVMPSHYTLLEVHDISLLLQHKLEAIDEVERAFVHVDYAKRQEPEHRTERLLAGLPAITEGVLSP